MFIWYRNSVLASIVSIIGCVIACTGIYGIIDKEIGVGPGILLIIAGIGTAALGSAISEQKAKKKAEQARRAQSGNIGGNTTRYSGNTGSANGTASQNAGTGRNTYGTSAPNTGNTQKTQEKNEALKDILRQAESCEKKDEFKKELDILLTGLSVDAENAELLNRIGRAYRRLGDYNTALDYYLRSAKADPNSLWIGTNIATAYLFLGEYEKADQYFRGEIRKLEASNNPQARDMLALTYANYALCVGRMGDLNKARVFLSKAEQAGYKNSDTVWKMLLKE